MHVHRTGWLDAHAAKPEGFVPHPPGVRTETVSREEKFCDFGLPYRSRIEVFGEDCPYEERVHRPVIGLWADDLPAAVAEPRAAAVDLLGGKGSVWQHCHGPDENSYELKEQLVAHA